ncbi:transcription factor HES-5 [Patagioenas fasciata monilis]|uniref:Transcription factor HES-5 n=1 Tax=Patagioenas fasciata monilis TaxID=372326 RepID=A0A1V4KNJ4_PATFA|nr:transcription factor HES-5 [Patagioenas fasciata monilis]
MAPSNTLVSHMEEKLLPKEKNKLRKPVVEKMRRDRINSSIEQLKLLLEKEFQRHQPNSKLEKADILEVAVSYLKQQSQLQDPSECRAAFIHKNLEQNFNSGYLRCLKEAMHFLSYYEPRKETQEGATRKTPNNLRRVWHLTLLGNLALFFETTRNGVNEFLALPVT